jgi:hypothetical protein
MDGTTKKRSRPGRKERETQLRIGDILVCKECGERYIAGEARIMVYAKGFTCQPCDERP